MNTPVLVVRCPEPADSLTASVFLLEGENPARLGFGEAARTITLSTGLPIDAARAALEGVRERGACHIGPAQRRSLAFGVAVVCPFQHLIELLTHKEWAQSRGEERYLDPAYRHVCFGAGGVRPQ